MYKVNVEIFVPQYEEQEFVFQTFEEALFSYETHCKSLIAIHGDKRHPSVKGEISHMAMKSNMFNNFAVVLDKA